MPIYKGTSEISKVYKGATPLDNVQVGSSELWTGVVVPTVVTNSSTISGTLITMNGNLTSDGGGTISQRGFYFGTSSTYTSNGKYTASGTSTGAYSFNIGSSSNTTYYITAFAVNEAGESVGSTVAFTTPWVVTTYTMRSDSKMYNNAMPSGGFNNSVLYYKTNYSGSIFANTRYNGQHALFNGYRNFNASGYPFDNRLVTNSDQMVVFGVEGNSQFSNKYTQLDIRRNGSRGFSNQSASIPFGIGNIWSDLTVLRMRAYVTNGSNSYLQYIAITFRYD